MRILAGIAFAAAVCAETPAFEVATIHPAPPITEVRQKMEIGAKMGIKIDQGRVDCIYQSLRDLIRYAYRVRDFQVTGPDWIRDERWVIAAKIPEGASKEQVPEMMQALLAERFKVVVHRETKDRPIYALVVAKDGLKLTPAEEGNAFEGFKSQRLDEGMLRMTSRSIPLSRLVDSLGAFADRPVIDMTGISGNFQVTLEAPMAEIKKSDEMKASGRMGDFGRPLAFDMVHNLGLRLDPRKAPVEQIVVDSAERKPTEN
jgi:uncharacterized protein (TIGR03435 family)